MGCNTNVTENWFTLHLVLHHWGWCDLCVGSGVLCYHILCVWHMFTFRMKEDYFQFRFYLSDNRQTWLMFSFQSKKTSGCMIKHAVCIYSDANNQFGFCLRKTYKLRKQPKHYLSSFSQATLNVIKLHFYSWITSTVCTLDKLQGVKNDAADTLWKLEFGQFLRIRTVWDNCQNWIWWIDRKKGSLIPWDFH